MTTDRPTGTGRAAAPCVLFALRREAMYFRRTYPPHRRLPGAPCPAWLAGSSPRTVLMLETGIGAEAAASAAGWLLANPTLDGAPLRPRFVLCAGFAGGLRDGLSVGDLLWADEGCDAAGRRWDAVWPGPTPGLPRGRLLTAERLVGGPREKRRLAERHGAAAVDMESAVVARLCQERGVPFGALRAVSDDARTPLSPELAEVLSRGRASPWRLLGAVMRRPRLVGELWRLAGQTRAAARALAGALEGLLGGGEPGEREAAGP